MHAIITTSKGTRIRGFVHKKQKSTTYITIPEPHPVVLYFNAAQSFYQRVEESRRHLFEHLESSQPNVNSQLNALYVFFSYMTAYTTFLYNTIESFMNISIPIDYKYKRIKNTQTEILDQKQIQRFAKFEEKIKSIIPEIKGKIFHIEMPQEYNYILKLKECRDEIIHTKNSPDPAPYGHLFNLALDFNYKDSISSVMTYINYYEPDLIEYHSPQTSASLSQNNS